MASHCRAKAGFSAPTVSARRPVEINRWRIPGADLRGCINDNCRSGLADHLVITRQVATAQIDIRR